MWSSYIIIRIRLRESVKFYLYYIYDNYLTLICTIATWHLELDFISLIARYLNN